MQDRFELPEPVTVMGETLHEVLLVTRLTTPAKPFNPVIVIVEVPVAPAFTATDTGLPLIVKSWTV